MIYRVLYLITITISLCFITEATPVLAKNTSEPSTFYEGNIDLSKTPKAYIEEASSIYSACKKNYKMNLNHDCKCYASAFLEQRVEKGNDVSQNTIAISLRPLCRNIENTTKQHHHSCMSDTYDPSEIGEHVTKADYCDCVANEWKKAYSSYQGDTSDPAFHREVSFAAVMTCKKKLSQQ